MSPATPPASTDFRPGETGLIASTLDEYAVLAIEGGDATEFLHAQLSSDVRSLAPGAAQLSAFHSAKGRVLANFLLFRARKAASAPRYLAILRGDLIESLRQRLSRFVLRAKVSLSAPQDLALIGLGGPGAAGSAASDFSASIESRHPEATAIPWPDGRVSLVVERGAQEAVIAAIESRGARRVHAAIWDWLGIRAGIPLIGAALSGELLPQALNWDVVGGITFQKGCYPGQEIIARTHYLGRAKERLYAFHVAAPPPAPATPLFSSAFGTQACGVVVNAAFDVDGGAILLASAQVDAAERGDLRLAAPDGARLAPQALPYALPAPRAQRDRIA